MTERTFIIISVDTYNDCGLEAFEDAFGPYTEAQADELLERLRANQGVGQSWRKHDLSSTKIYDPYSGNSIEPEEN